MIQPEQESQRERVVHLNEEFLMFDPARTRTEFNQTLQVNQFNGGLIVLETDFLPPLPLDLLALPSRTDKKITVTPFNPDLGYTVTNEDFKLQSRLEKVKKMRHDERVNFTKAPLFLAFSQEAYAKFKAEELAKFQQLRVQLTFPNGLRFEGQPSELFLQNEGGIRFWNFYPMDTGPLPASKDTTTQLLDSVEQGFSLYVPSDRNKLSQIKAKIIRVNEDRTQEDEESIKPSDGPIQTKNGNGVPDAFKEAFKGDKDW